jgi:hypothetical protein
MGSDCRLLSRDFGKYSAKSIFGAAEEKGERSENGGCGDSAKVYLSVAGTSIADKVSATRGDRYEWGFAV